MSATTIGRRFRKATIKDVAARAGVSPAAVSVLLSGNRAVCSPETERRIREVIAELHYVPGPGTRGASARATRIIGGYMAAPGDAMGNVANSFAERLFGVGGRGGIRRPSLSQDRARPQRRRAPAGWARGWRDPCRRGV